MILVGLYLLIVVAFTTGLLGHPQVLASMTHRAVAWARQRAAQGRRGARGRPAPSWVRRGDR